MQVLPDLTGWSYGGTVPLGAPGQQVHIWQHQLKEDNKVGGLLRGTAPGGGQCEAGWAHQRLEGAQGHGRRPAHETRLAAHPAPGRPAGVP